MLRCLVLAAMLIGSAWAQEAEDRSVIVVVKRDGDKLTLVEKLEDPGACPPQHGTPQFARMFFEVTGEDGDVMFAATIGETRFAHGDQYDVDGKISGGLIDAKDQRLELRFPRFEGARRFTAYRRSASGEDEGEREVLLEVDL
jgi:hypothetical protein